jgi:hypothetical protein
VNATRNIIENNQSIQRKKPLSDKKINISSFSVFDADCFFELILLRAFCISLQDKLHQKGPTSVKFQKLNFLIFHPILKHFLCAKFIRIK